MLQNIIQYKIKNTIEKNRDRIAIEYGDKYISYEELDKRSEQVSFNIMSRGLLQGSFIGVFTNNKIDVIVSMIGILKAGCVFVPLEPSYPLKRIESMVKAAELKYIIADEDGALKLAGLSDSIREGLEFIIANEPSENVVVCSAFENMEYNPESPVYVYFTSGSTGEPKAIVGRNKSLVHFMEWEINTFNIDENFCVSQFTSICHDPYLRDVFVPLIAGGKCCIPESRETILDTRRLISWIEESGINLIHCTPSLFKVFNVSTLSAQNFEKLKAILLAGERIQPDELKNWYNIFNDRIQLVNMYGPTETTLAKLYYPIDSSDCLKRSIPLGKPIKGARVIILDSNMEICDVGVAGELYIRTPYMTHGYHNNPELNSAKFIRNPFNNEKNETIYKTGDLGMLLEDGNIEFLGRVDRQVKIRGYRVELDDIENTLSKNENIREAVVVYRKAANNESRLFAYVVLKDGVEENTSLYGQLNEYLEERLMDYMIPDSITVLDKLPLNSNGKIDYKALPEPKENRTLEYKPPKDEIEAKLVDIWCELLGRERVSVDVDFLKAGGHSLNAMNLIARIHREFDIELHLGQIFEGGSIESLANYIRESGPASIYESIVPVDKRDYYPVSSAQKRLFVLDMLSEKNTTYNLPGAVLIEGSFDTGVFENAVRQLIRRHESFRTSFQMVDGEIVQKIHDNVEFDVWYSEACENELGKTIKEFVKPFDISKAPLLRIGLVRLSSKKHVMLLDMHHIVSDGTSLGIFVRELLSISKGLNLAPLRISYKDYAVWQKEAYSTDVLKKQEEYWVNRFSGGIPLLNMKTDFPRPSVQSYEGNVVYGEIDENLAGKLKKLAGYSGATLYMVLLAGYNVLLHKYTGQDDLIVGSPVAGRNHADLQDVIGVFVNTLAMRNFPAGKKTFSEFLNEVRINTLEAFENQNYQFEELIDRLEIKRDVSRNPIFDTMFILQNMGITKAEMDGLVFKEYPVAERASKFDMTISAIEEGSKVRLEIEYCTSIFRRDTIERILNHFINLLNEASENPDIEISDMRMISNDESNRLLYTYNDTITQYQKDETIHRMFEKQADRTPEAVALVFDDKKFTYKALNERANRLSENLVRCGVNPGSTAAVMMNRSPEMLIGILAILKAGGAYIPLDPGYPAERIQFMLDDSGAKVLLTSKDISKGINLSSRTVYLDDPDAYSGDGRNLAASSGPNDLAYIIYTSGSTGKPKGVMIEHKSVINFIKGMTDKIDFSQDKAILAITTISFDISVLELLMPLTLGLKIILADETKQKDPELLVKEIVKNNVKILQATPSTIQMLVSSKNALHDMAGLSEILAGGEPITGTLLEKLKQLEKARIYNVYGPTETTIWSTVKELTYEDKIDIGRPIANTRIYILDKYNKIVPEGLEGELCIAGDGLSRGYLGRPELTKEKFTENPYVKGDRIYRTGDLARWLPGGNIEFLGRIDYQVKIRGFRIELGEIETCLLKHKDINEAVVVIKEDKHGNKHLCAYMSMAQALTVAEIREHLLKELPDYMVPSWFVQLEKMPMTPNNKIDRKALPEPDGSMYSDNEYIAPKDEIEEKLVEICQEVLGIEKIGTGANFFELGGHSLKAISLASRIHKELNVDIPLHSIFREAVISKIADLIRNSRESKYLSIKPVENKEYYDVSSAQKRMFISYMMDQNSTAYNMPLFVIIEGKLDRKRFEETFQKLIERHEILRTSFELIDGTPVQKIHEHFDFTPEYRVGTDIEFLKREFIKPFDLKKMPLFNACLVKIDEEKHLFMYDTHHIISDAVSLNIIIHEFADMYRGAELPELKLRYRDFSKWQNDLFSSERIKEQEDYWVKVFEGEIPRLNMPLDFTRPPKTSFDGETLFFKLDNDQKQKIKSFVKETGTTIYIFLLSAYNILLSKYTGQTDIIVGSPISGRPVADLENVLGVFINTLAMRNFPSANKTVKEFVEGVRQNAIKAYENQDYQLEMLLDKLGIVRESNRNPLFDTMFIMQNAAAFDIEVDGLRFIPTEVDTKTAKFDFKLEAYENEASIDFSLDYCTRLFEKETMEQLIRHFTIIVEKMLDNSEIMIQDIDISSGEEDMLSAFNDLL